MAGSTNVLRHIGVTLVLTLVSVHLGRAQTTVDSFAALPQVIERGTNVFVEDETGQRTKGKVTDIGGGIGYAIDGTMDGQRLVFSRRATVPAPGLSFKLRF